MMLLPLEDVTFQMGRSDKSIKSIRQIRCHRPLLAGRIEFPPPLSNTRVAKGKIAS